MKTEREAFEDKLKRMGKVDDRQSKEHIIEKCESIIQELLKE